MTVDASHCLILPSLAIRPGWLSPRFINPGG
jgi:hypothetical protein